MHLEDCAFSQCKEDQDWQSVPCSPWRGAGWNALQLCVCGFLTVLSLEALEGKQHAESWEDGWSRELESPDAGCSTNSGTLPPAPAWCQW